MDSKWSDEEIERLADKLAQEFRDIDPHLLFKALPAMFEHFCDEGMKADKDDKKEYYFACLSHMILSLGSSLLMTGAVIPDIQDKSKMYNAFKKGSGGLN